MSLAALRAAVSISAAAVIVAVLTRHGGQRRLLWRSQVDSRWNNSVGVSAEASVGRAKCKTSSNAMQSRMQKNEQQVTSVETRS